MARQTARESYEGNADGSEQYALFLFQLLAKRNATSALELAVFFVFHISFFLFGFLLFHFPFFLLTIYFTIYNFIISFIIYFTICYLFHNLSHNIFHNLVHNL